MNSTTKEAGLAPSIYQVFPRCHSEAGTLSELARDLPRIRSMGFDYVYLMPIHPSGMKCRKGRDGSPYAVQDYFAVDPSIGTLADFKALAEQAHSLGLKVMMDIVINHSAPDNVWVKQHPDFYLRDSRGRLMNKVPDWSDVADFDYRSKSLRKELIRMLCYWADQGADAYRCDVASLVPADFWVEARAAVAKNHPGFLWMAESVESDMILAMRRDGWPIESDPQLCRAFDVLYSYDTEPWLNRALADEDLTDYERIVNFREAEYPQGFLKMHCLENHDRRRSASLTANWSVLQNRLAYIFLARGAAFVYAGQEAWCTRTPSLFDRDPVDWSKLDRSYMKYLKHLNTVRSRFLGEVSLAVLAENPQALSLTEYSGRRCWYGLFNVLGKKGALKAGVRDGEYRNLIDGSTVTVADGRIRAAACPVFLSVKKEDLI